MKWPANRCRGCGGSEFVDCVDNFGRPYRGCARCRILTKEEIDKVLQGGQR